MDSEQNDARLLQGAPALDSDLPEVPVKCPHDTRFGLRPIQQGDVTPSGQIRARPQDVMAPVRSGSAIGLGKFSAARRRIYAGIGNALYSWAR
jgi:hypothetical protein